MSFVDFEETAKILGEGFLADRIVDEKNIDRAKEYINGIVRGRKFNTDNVITETIFEDMHNYLRFMKWIAIEYEKKEQIKTQREFLDTKLDELVNCKGCWLDFFKWLQRETLTEVSRLMHHP